MRPARQDEGPSEDTRKKAQAAKSYIENMYKVQYQNYQQRTDRCSLNRLKPVCKLESTFGKLSAALTGAYSWRDSCKPRN